MCLCNLPRVVCLPPVDWRGMAAPPVIIYIIIIVIISIFIIIIIIATIDQTVLLLAQLDFTNKNPHMNLK